MLISFHLDSSGNYVGEGDHDPKDLRVGGRVRFTHFNYRISRLDGELNGVYYVGVNDEKTNSGVTPKRKWS